MQLAFLQRDMHELKVAVAAMQAERDHALKWGIVTLGAAVISMGLWIFNLFTGGHLK